MVAVIIKYPSNIITCLLEVVWCCLTRIGGVFESGKPANKSHKIWSECVFCRPVPSGRV
jgi:hypothetical protein